MSCTTWKPPPEYENVWPGKRERVTGSLLAGESPRRICSCVGRGALAYPGKPWHESPAVCERRRRRVIFETRGRVLGVEIQESCSVLK